MKNNDHKPGVLYIDDEVINLTSFKYQFKDFYNIYIAESAMKGYELLKKHDIDVIIADQRMPKMTGIDFFEMVMPEYPNKIRIILTGYSDIKAVIDGINVGKIYYYMQKPWHEEDIKMVIKNAMDTIQLENKNHQLITDLKQSNDELKNKTFKLKAEITVRAKVEKELKKLLLAVEQSPAVIVMTDTDGRIEYINPAFERVTGYSKEEAMANNFKIINSGKQPASFFKELWGTITQGKVWTGEIINKKKNGELFWEHAIIAPIFNEVKEITHYVGVKQDITKRKQLEDDLIKAKEKAEESDKLKSAFLANMSHEIRTPMNGIIGFSELLSNPDISKENLKSYSNIITKSGYQLLNIVNDILDFSQLEIGKLNIFKVEMSINELINDLFEFYKPEAERSSLALNFNCGLTDTESIIISDSTRIRQVLSNLLTNSFKFTSEGSIHFGYKLVGKNLIFHVEDTGIGIAPEMQEIIFERFRQVEVESNVVNRGLGLGLSISKKVIELLGGKIWLDTDPDTGSKFYFSIPYIPVKDSISVVEEKQTISFPSKFTCLVAEDDEINFIYIKNILIKIGITVLHAINGIEAVEMCKINSDIDMVLMDLKMPILDGYEATKQILKFKPELPVIAQTAYAMASDKSKALEIGCSDYLTKPIKKDELLLIAQKYFKKN